MISIYKRELKSFFTTYIGYIFVSFILLTTGIYSWFINYLNQSPEFEYILFNLNFIFLIAVPILTMRTIADERRQKTDILLYSLPLKCSSIILGKYFAQLTVLLIPTLIICIYPLILMTFGTISAITCYSTILGFFLMGAALIAIGVFISSVTENQIVSAITTFAVLFIIYLSSTISNGISTAPIVSFLAFCIIIMLLGLIIAYFTKNSTFGILVAALMLSGASLLYVFCTNLYEGAIQKSLSFISVFDRLSYFVTGIFDVTTVIYYLSVCVLFCFLSVKMLGKRRWS